MKRNTRNEIRNLQERYYGLGRRLEQAVLSGDVQEQAKVITLVQQTLAAIRQRNTRR